MKLPNFLHKTIFFLLCTFIISNAHYCDELLEQAHQEIQKNNFENALTITQEALVNCYSKDSAYNCAQLLLELGNHFFGKRKSSLALTSFNSILSLSDNFSVAHHNIAFTMAEQLGKYQEALPHYRKAVTLKPKNAEAHFCYGMSLLATENYYQGFKEYEWRWQRPKKPRSFEWKLPKLWNGTADIENKTILLRVEQGMGDTLHFIRYAQLLHQQGAIVTVEVQKPLVDLLSLCPYLKTVFEIGKPLPKFDFQIPIISLPFAFKTTKSSIPSNIPYLFTDKELTNYWKQELEQDTNFKVGIVWYGDKCHGPGKFMPLKRFTALTDIPGVSFYSLQRFDGLDQLEQLKDSSWLRIFDTDFDKTNGRFMDTAAVMKNLDLIITVDTSLAHLAGGLGVPVWIILPFPAEWRWLQDRSNSPWYPTMKLFRQQEYGGWDTVVKELRETLQEII